MKLYTKTVCPKCLLVKDALKRKGITLEEEINIDINEESKQFIVQNGIMAAPVLEVEGRLISDVSEMLGLIDELAE